MSNQTSFLVERNIVERMTGLVRVAAPEAVVGIPTLGLTYARAVAEAIGLPDFVALGYSRKFWYDDALSEAMVSSTSPDQSKRIYLDPALLERVQGRRVVVVERNGVPVDRRETMRVLLQHDDRCEVVRAVAGG